eukprot:269714_1
MAWLSKVNKATKRAVAKARYAFRGGMPQEFNAAKAAVQQHKLPWLPPGWPAGGWFNLNPGNRGPFDPQRMPEPDQKFIPKKKKNIYRTRKWDKPAERMIDDIPLDALRKGILQLKGTIYFEDNIRRDPKDIEQEILERYEKGVITLTEQEQKNFIKRALFFAEQENEDDWKHIERLASEQSKKPFNVKLTDELREGIKKYSVDRAGFGWKDPYEMSAEAVIDESEEIRSMHLVYPGMIAEEQMSEWQFRQGEVCAELRANGLPPRSGDVLRLERTGPLPFRDQMTYTGNVPNAEDIYGPPGSAWIQSPPEKPTMAPIICGKADGTEAPLPEMTA